MKTMRGVILAVVLGIGLVVAPAQAIVVSNYLAGDCPSCYGSTYRLDIDVPESGNTYTATLVIDTTGYTGAASFISAVDFKAANDVWVNNDSLVDFRVNDVSSSLKSEWITSEKGINSAGCAASGTGFVCSKDALPSAAPIIDGTYTWVWNFTLSSGASLDLTDIHIGAKYNNEYGTLNGQITSESVPEPATILLLGTGLLALGGFAWRRNRKG